MLPSSSQVRTPVFQAENRGSNPLGSTNICLCIPSGFYPAERVIGHMWVRVLPGVPFLNPFPLSEDCMPSSNITVRTTDSKLEQFCDIIHTHQLSASDGIMQTWCRTPQYVKIAALAYNSNTPIAAALLMKQRHGLGNILFGVYVKTKFRRKKIGSRIVKAVYRRNKNRFLVFKDRLDAKGFYDSLGLELQTGNIFW